MGSTAMTNTRLPVSGAFFCPQARAPDSEYLNGLRSFFLQDKHGCMLLKAIKNLKTDNVWSIFAQSRAEVAALSQGPHYVDMFHDWTANGVGGPLAEARSGIVALPLLVALQIGQYLRYLAHHGLSHREFLDEVKPAGGLQGYCGGLPSAMAASCARDEAELVQHTATTMRILLGVGAYGEFADDSGGSGTTTLALRLKYEGQGDELTEKFPGTHVSAITEPRTVSIVGPADTLQELFLYAQDQGLQVQKVDIRGKVHNPDNGDLAAELCRLCRETPSLQLPDASQLQVPVRSNRDGRRLVQGSLSDELVTTILASRCEWYRLLGEVANDVEQSGRSNPSFVYFGLTDCVPRTPFVEKGLHPTKTAAHTLIQRIKSIPAFPEDALAVVGASCRLPGANNLEELWDMLAAGTDRHQKLTTERFDLHGGFRATQSGNFAKERTFYGNLIDDVQRFDNAFFGVSAREAANMDPQQRLLLELSYEALNDSGYLVTHKREDADNVGCFIGASLVEYLDNTNAHAPTAYTSTGTIRAFLCGRLSYYYGWSGPAEVVDTACSSSLVAINRACKAVQNGECRMALAGGVNLITGMNNYFDLGKAGFLSATGQCKPFDAAADGYCRSDGAGLVVIKKLSTALAEGNAIMGVISGVATNQGGLSASITVPHSAAQIALYRNVLKQAHLSPEKVTYIEAHGTGTQAGDPLEIESIRSVFNRSQSETQNDNIIHVGSIKGNIGHCETAAGVAGLLKTLAMIKHGQLPPQVNHNSLNPKIGVLEPDGLAIVRKLRSWDAPLRAALVNSYGAAGSNCALLCCEMPAVQQQAYGKALGDINVTLPLMITASSQKGVLDNSRAIGAYLRQHSGSLDLADVALTLNQRRQRLQFMGHVQAGSVSNAAGLLEGLNASDIFQPPKDPKAVVLVFSGQYNNKVGLDESLYDRFPALQFYIDACDAELKKQGFPTIIPAIFTTQPLSDVVTLQCSIFAMQYACAQCWIDAGVKISAIIGHSLGEITALAVSGVLSLSDAIKLVAARAHLINTKWGSEKGAMLTLSNCSVQQFQDICLLLQKQSGAPTHSPQLEIACHNAPSTLVAVGTSAAVDSAESVLRTEPSLQKVRAQRLATSHGFHSTLMEPILADLAIVADSLEWGEPNIALEVCRQEPLRTMKRYSPSKHAREPVFFFEAVRRVEDRLGPVTFLEAGVDTPVAAMVRSAVQRPESHSFHSIKTKGSPKPAVDVVSDVVSSLWRRGVFPTHWRLIPVKGTCYCKPIWLPPYQFERTRHWITNIDRVMEMQKTMSKISPSVAVQDGIPLAAPSLKLVVKRTSPGAGPTEFIINTESQRYRFIVEGHAVRSRSLCPASMYMECIIMSLQLLLNDASLSGANLVFEEVLFNSALSIGPEGEVIVRLEQLSVGASWKWTLRTLLPEPGSPKAKEIAHARGRVFMAPSAGFDVFQRLVSGPMKRMDRDDNENAERLMSKRTYSLFSRVVDYAPFFHGIHSIALHGYEAIATVRLPDGQPGLDESTASRLCDAVAVDAFIQVVGFLMNTSDHVAANEVMVMVALDHASISPACKMDNLKQQWRIYAKFGFTAEQQPIGDVFVCNSKGNLVAVLTGCRFAKLPIARLEKMLDAGRSEPPVPQSEAPAIPSISPVTTSTEDGGIVTPATSITSSAQGTSDSIGLALRELIAEYTGTSASEMAAESMLADLGLDSLASVELVGELSSKFGLTFDSGDLIGTTLDELYQRLGVQCPSVPAPAPLAPRTSTAVVTQSEKSPYVAGGQPDQRLPKLLEVLSQVSSAKSEDIKLSDLLADLGVDSLSAMDLKQELEDGFSVRIDDIMTDITVQDLMTQLGIAAPGAEPQVITLSGGVGQTGTANYSPAGGKQEAIAGESAIVENPFDALKESDAHFHDSASKRNYVGYWSNVAPFQDELLVAYIVEAFAKLEVDLARFSPGDRLPQIPFQSPKYDRLVPRLWEILKKHGIVTSSTAGGYKRGGRDIEGRSAAQLQAAFQEKFSEFRDESALIALTGPKLADCLSGKVDSVAIMFGSPASLKIMENFYGHSPMMSTLTDQLAVYLTALLKTAVKERPVQILEVGAGTGGTTKRLAAGLDTAGISAQYTFTDIAPSLVSKAKTTFKPYDWFDFTTFNLEKDVPEAMRGRFDVVVSTNCVHATTNRTASCRRLRETLKPGGIIVLSEVTRVMDWYDICFGLLDGWWLAENRTAYPIQLAETWMSIFAAAGFASASSSGGPTPESTSQQLLVACNKHWNVPAKDIGGEGGSSFRKETLVYKEVSGVQIYADVYFPCLPPPSAMPIALMIHGGGHMTLSRRAIRPTQTRYLLANGFLPVSIDYRLCPEVNLVDGPMTDVCDAYRWTRTILPGIATEYGVTVKADKVVLIGWSTGGQLAMSVGWTARAAGMPAPSAVLSFYAPVDLESGELDAARLKSLPGRKMSLKRILASLPTQPITTYDNSAQGDSTKLGWVRPGDPRSELVLALFKENIGLPLMLNGLPKGCLSSEDDIDWPLAPPSPERIASVSPLARLRVGQYSCPTFVIHSAADEIAPFAGAERFVRELEARGVPHGFLPLQNLPHIHDLHLTPEMREWEEQVAPGYRFLFETVCEQSGQLS